MTKEQHHYLWINMSHHWENNFGYSGYTHKWCFLRRTEGPEGRKWKEVARMSKTFTR